MNGRVVAMRWEEHCGNRWWYATPLEWAASNGYVELAMHMIDADPSLLNDLSSLKRLRRLELLWDDHQALSHATKNRGSLAAELINHCKLHSLVEAGYGPWLLYTAASASDVDLVCTILKENPSLVYGDHRQYTLSEILYGAAKANNVSILQEMVRCAEESKNTLPFSNAKHQSMMCRCLGLEVSTDNVMSKVLHACVAAGAVEIVKTLLQECREALLLCRDDRGGLAIHTAASNGHVDVVREIANSAPVTVEATDEKGNTAVHSAAISGHWDCASELLRRAPSVWRRVNSDGENILHAAVRGDRDAHFADPHRYHTFIRKLLGSSVAAGLVNGRNMEGRTALHMAVMAWSGKRPCEDVVNIFAVAMEERGLQVDVNVRDVSGMSVLQLLKAAVYSGIASLHVLSRLRSCSADSLSTTLSLSCASINNSGDAYSSTYDDQSSEDDESSEDEEDEEDIVVVREGVSSENLSTLTSTIGEESCSLDRSRTPSPCNHDEEFLARMQSPTPLHVMMEDKGSSSSSDDVCLDRLRNNKNICYERGGFFDVEEVVNVTASPHRRLKRIHCRPPRPPPQY